ncbi:MAG: glycosyltransferase family 4 protein [Candidatus Pseudomonas colombiensis]|uniref:Glycosyltransferase family 4 protein n=1 Tax=Pseudomonas morbosilactucae TaxID=2938197 RepID=A0ABT0JM54_9PSED|nr:glycosyltransferase family 4 protein [Pseudomonas morbosilactucae]MCK9816906.1 glycosyltransferase family 4 protein [Pseudomonas morbosilactucae]WEK10591.1 MAG: glycosyltransferase family 4 protein [Pseudomonas sp.]
MTVLGVLAFSALLAWLLTAVLRRYALSRSVLDIPNARSSHTVPTPRGGGVAIVVSFLGGLIALTVLVSDAPLSLFWALLGAGAGVALLGFLDDHGHIAARWRLLGHFLAALWALYWLGGVPALSIFGLSVDFGVFGYGLAALYLVWLLNLYNFMDGIDGIASVEAVCACLGGALCFWLVTDDVTSLESGALAGIYLPVLLAMATAGFLVWNFPPAKIFMGDAGSGFLGVVLGILSLHAAWHDPSLLWCWLILLGVFVVDATLTLFRRLLRGEKVYEAHRSHAYQFASRQYGRHLPVTVAVAGLNLLWLLPLAVCVAKGVVGGVSGLVLAYAPLLFIAFKYRAGLAEQEG